MKRVALLLAVTSCFLSRAACAVDQPRGNLLELHSCELYAGGCIVSSEEPQDGRYMLRAWNFTGGNFAGAELAGLQVALLESSSENLAASKTMPNQAVVYLPSAATPAQQKTLLAWLEATQPELKSAVLQTRKVPLRFKSAQTECVFSAGSYLSISTASLESCATGSCGESLWYTPRSQNNVFTVAVNHSSQVSEPLLKLTWKDAGKRSVFLARFGDETPMREVFVTTADFCAPNAARLF